MRRFADWPQRLARAVDIKRRAPYAWGENDCALCAADLVASQTGQDFGAPFRGRYSDEEGARAILQALGHADLADLVDSCLPRNVKPKRGDVVLQPSPSGNFLTVMWGGGVVGPGERGLILVPRAPQAISWSVG